MAREFYGVRINNTFILPDFEIKGGKIEIIDSQEARRIFPNGGTVHLRIPNDGREDEISDRIIKFAIDFAHDLGTNFNRYDENSDQFSIPYSKVSLPDKDEVIQIVEMGKYSIDEFLSDPQKAGFDSDFKPNHYVLLRNGGECYGPVECVSTYDTSRGRYKVFAVVDKSKDVINAYDYSVMERYIYDAKTSIRRNAPEIRFIMNLQVLENVKVSRQIESFSDADLAEYLRSLLALYGDLNALSAIKDSFLRAVESLEGKKKLSRKKNDRIMELLEQAEDLRDCVIRLAERYFKDSPAAEADKMEYLESHSEVLMEMIRKDLHYEDKTARLRQDLEEKTAQVEEINGRIAEAQQILQNREAEVGAMRAEAEASIRLRLNELQQEYDRLEAKCLALAEDQELYEKNIRNLRAEHREVTGQINDRIAEWAAQKRSSGMIDFLFAQSGPQSDVQTDARHFTWKPETLKTASGEEIATILADRFTKAGRSMSKDEIYNLLITVTQSYITVFAGNPGTGKTSLCVLLAKALGLYEERFAEISVERGWTSSRDLIGYYNPLSKEIERTQPEFSECMERLDAQHRAGIAAGQNAPYFCLLDEANLSPIEFYWSQFNFYVDSPEKQKVTYANGVTLELGEELKFLATINYDHTTSDLSPRFLDRAWVISMNQVSVENILSAVSDAAEIENNPEMISLQSLQDAFGWKSHKEETLNQVTRTRLDMIIRRMNEGGHPISARTLQAIRHYCIVAEGFMSSKEAALDFAVSQKILPCINGSGPAYTEFLKELLNICKQTELPRSAAILSSIMKKSTHEFYSYFIS